MRVNKDQKNIWLIKLYIWLAHTKGHFQYGFFHMKSEYIVLLTKNIPSLFFFKTATMFKHIAMFFIIKLYTQKDAFQDTENQVDPKKCINLTNEQNYFIIPCNIQITEINNFCGKKVKFLGKNCLHPTQRLSRLVRKKTID